MLPLYDLFFLNRKSINSLTSSLKLVLDKTRDIWKPEALDYKQTKRPHELKKHYISIKAHRSKNKKRGDNIWCLLKNEQQVLHFNAR